MEYQAGCVAYDLFFSYFSIQDYPLFSSDIHVRACMNQRYIFLAVMPGKVKNAECDKVTRPGIRIGPIPPFKMVNSRISIVILTSRPRQR